MWSVRPSRRHLWAVMLSVIPGLCAGAQGIEEIVVVAQKREQGVQEVPISITAFSGSDLEQRGLNDLQRLARFVPNLDLPSSNNLRNTSVRIRGVGSSGTNPGIESSVGTFLDGLYMPTGAMSLGELTDINTIEVLRGPQGTLYGRNTPVGAINITTRRPTQSFNGLLRAGGGDFDHRWVNGYVGGGLGGAAAGRVAFYYRDRDGYEDNGFLGGRVNDNEEKGLRGRVLVEPSDAVEVNLTAYYTEQRRRCCVNEQIDPFGPSGIATPGFLAASEAIGFPYLNTDDDDHEVFADDEGDDRTESWGASATLDWSLPGGHVLTSVTGWQDWDNDVVLAADSLPQPVLLSNQHQINEVLSQELRIASPTGGRIEYLAGIYLYGQDTTFDTRTTPLAGANRVFPLPPALCAPPCRLTPGNTALTRFDQETRSAAAFGSLTGYLSDAWDITVGLRFSIDDKEAVIRHLHAPGAVLPLQIVFPRNDIGEVDRRDENVTWSVNSRYRFSDDVMGFVSVATGFKSGGFNATRVSPGTPIEFEEEESISYEAGVKSTWLDRRVQLNATLYWTVLEDFQETSLNLETGTGFIVANAGEQRSRGVEADVIVQPLPELTLNASFALLDAEYTEYPNAQCGLGETPTGAGGTCDREGDTPAFSPEWRYALGAEWVQPLGGSDLELRLRADYAWVDAQNLIRVTLDEPGDQDAYGLLDLRAAIGALDGRWTVEAFVDNVQDEVYFIQAVGQPAGGLISGGGVAGAQGYAGFYGPPRAWGLQITWRPGS